MDDHEDDCVSLEAATPILVLSAPTTKSFHAKFYFVDISNLEIIPEDNCSRVAPVKDQSHPLLLRPLSTPLLI
jgi:hypothetical protein